MSPSRTGELAVVGGGVIGLAVAWRAARVGWRVRLHDPTPARGSSWVAGGMLAPLTEGWPGEDVALSLGMCSAELWPGFAAELAVDAGRDPGLSTTGTVVVGLDAADHQQLEVLAGWLADHGRSVAALRGTALHRRVPALAQQVRRGLDVPGDRSVDNRALLAALRGASDAAGVRHEAAPVTDLAGLAADQVVVAAGARSAALLPGLPVHPVKGEVVRLRHRRGVLPAPAVTLRALVHGRPVYLVPRLDGVVVGATQYEAGFDEEPTAGGVRQLLEDAEAVVPSVAEHGLTEAAAGLRPTTPDGLPLLGRLDARTVVATGHGRNGILLAPLTADAVLAELAGHPLAEASATDPRRFRPWSSS